MWDTFDFIQIKFHDLLKYMISKIRTNNKNYKWKLPSYESNKTKTTMLTNIYIYFNFIIFARKNYSTENLQKIKQTSQKHTTLQ